MPFSSDQLNTLQNIIHVCSSLSCIGSSAVIFTYLFNTKFNQQSSNRLVFWMTVADFLAAFHLFFGTWTLTIFDSAGFCTYQGYMIQYFLLAAMLWTACMSFHCLLAIRKKSSIDAKAYEKYYHLVCWGIPGLFSGIMAIYAAEQAKSNVMGNATLWCWINSTNSSLRFIFFYSPLWTIFGFNLMSYAYIGFTLSKSNIPSQHTHSYNAKSRQLLGRFIKKTSLFLLAFFFNWIWASVNRIQNSIDPSHPIFVLFVLQATFTPLQGFINSLVYFWITFIGIYKSKDTVLPLSNSKSESKFKSVQKPMSVHSESSNDTTGEEAEKRFSQSSFDPYGKYDMGALVVTNNDSKDFVVMNSKEKRESCVSMSSNFSYDAVHQNRESMMVNATPLMTLFENQNEA